MRELLTKLGGYKSRFNPSLYCFQKTVDLGPRRSLLVSGPSGVGTSSVLIDLCREYLLRDYHVFYFDCADAITPMRIPDFVNTKFFLIRPSGSEGLIQILSSLHKNNLDEKIAIVIDAAFVMSDRQSIVFKNNLGALRDYITRAFPEASLIVSQRKDQPIGLSYWTSTLEVIRKSLITDDRERFGHTVLLKGPKGEIKTYIDYRYGRISHAYDFASKQVNEEGKLPNSIFIWDDEEYRGIWVLTRECNFLEKFNDIRN